MEPVDRALADNLSLSLEDYAEALRGAGLISAGATEVLRESGGSVWLSEHHLYGTAALGIRSYPDPGAGSSSELCNSYWENRYGLSTAKEWYSCGYGEVVSAGQRVPWGAWSRTVVAELHHTVGLRQYSVSDHLGNVLATVLDRKSGHGSGQYYDYWLADVSSATDYYPFGMPMQERMASPERYRLGYNGQQKSDEVYGKGNLNTALFWEYDTRLARRWNVDPVMQSSISAYSVLGGNPIVNVDPLGNIFFGLFGSTSAQREAASNYAAQNGGEVKNKWSRDIYVPATYFYVAPGTEDPAIHGYNQQFNKDGSLYSPNGEIKRFVPDEWDRWAADEHLLPQIGYGIVDGIHITGQSLFLSPFTGQKPYHLDGTNTTVDDRVGAFSSTVLLVAPSAGIETKAASITEGAFFQAGTKGFRYMSQGELAAIQKTGYLRGGIAGETYFTKDLYKSGLSAQSRLSLGNLPSLRVEFEILNNPAVIRNGTKVLPANGMIGRGSEFMTTDPVKVRILNWQPLR